MHRGPGLGAHGLARRLSFAPEIYEATGTVWRWTTPSAPAAWFFLTIDPGTAAAIRAEAFDRIGGWGSVKVTAQIGATRWQTSLFPNKETRGYLLPLKAAVRKAEGLSEGDAATVRLEI